MLVKPKDPDPKEKSGVIYSYQCGAIDCGEEYISETSRTLRERYKEHLREPSPIQVDIHSSGHQLREDNFNIIGREDQDLTMSIKESIYIRETILHLIGILISSNLIMFGIGALFSSPNIKVAIPAGNVQHSS